MELILVRHAESIWNAEDRWQGQTDVPLSERGRAEAEALGARLAALRADAVVSSDLSRARDTADAVIAAMRARGGAPRVRRHEGLREMDLGAWCGLPHSVVYERFKEDLDALQRGDDRRIGGHGESLPMFEDRVHGALAQVLEQESSSERVLVVTHGGCIRAVVMRLLELRGRKRPLEGAGNTSLTTLEVEGRTLARLVTYNDRLHLERTSPAGAETIVGPAGRERAIEVLGLGPEARLAPVTSDARTTVLPPAGRLVEYGVRSWSS